MSHRIFSKEIIPAESITLITPSDTAIINFNGVSHATRGISFATAGILRVITREGEDIAIPDGALAAGIIHPMSVIQVYATDTTATGIVGYR